MDDSPAIQSSPARLRPRERHHGEPPLVPPEGLFTSKSAMILKNLAFSGAAILLWVALRCLFIWLHWSMGRDAGKFLPFDVALVVLPPVAAFFFNWYWLRRERTQVIMRWALTWACGDFVAFAFLVLFLAAPLHGWLSQLS